MRKHIYIFLLSVVSILATGCTDGTRKADDGKLNIIVSIPPEKYLVESIGGEHVNVESVMTSDANPESFEPTVAAMLALADADMYIPLGVLDFEKPLIDKLGSNSPDLKIANCIEGVGLLYDTHGDCSHHSHEVREEHHHDAPDPHVWSSAKNMKIMAGNIAEILMNNDSEHADYYAMRRDSLITRIDSIESALSTAIAASDKGSFMVWHPSLSYLANDYGLKQITVGSHAKELSVKQLQERIEDAATSGANLFFVQQEFDSNQAETVNGHINAKIVRLNTMSEDWENEIKKISDGFGK